MPPCPESPPLYHESFDQDYFSGETNCELTIFGLGFLDESWSGYALRRTGEAVAPFVIPALNANGQTNIQSDTGGALRWWVNPSWTSGASNSNPAILVEMDAVSGSGSAYAWSLQVSADGNTVQLLTQTDAGVQEVLEASISWLAGASHNVILDFGTQGTALFLDGALAAQGAGVASVPAAMGQLALGSTLAGADTAGADFEEFYSFGSWLTDTNAALYYGMTASEAALGPISYVEQTELSHRRGGHQEDSIHSPGNVFDPENVTPCSPGGPFYITNIAATLQPNGATTASFDIFGGTNGVFYDIFSTQNLNNNLASNQWLWIGQGLTCNSFTFTNQPGGQAFYTLELPAETFTIGFDGDNDYGQIDVPDGLTNAIAVAAGGYFSLALSNNGTVIGWGDSSYGATGVPAGLSNVVAIAAGLYHGVALRADGSVTNWGSYYDGGSNLCSVTNRTYASAPPTSGVVAVAAGMGQDLALLSNGTCVAWGYTNVYGTGAAYGTMVPTNLNLTNVTAVACGWQFNLALSSNGMVAAWGIDDTAFGNPTNVPADLASNVAAIAAGGNNGVALRTDGTVEAWGDPYSGVTNVPAGLTNVVAVATGGEAGLALQADGTVVAWGDVTLTNIPAGMLGVKAISAGFDHNLVIESGLLTPVIFSQPSDQYAPSNATVTFSVAGMGVAGLQYQWYSNGMSVTGATNATLTFTATPAANNSSYQAIITSYFGSITSSMATFTLVTPPLVTSYSPTNPGITWLNYFASLSVAAMPMGIPGYPLSYGWQINGTNLAGYFSYWDIFDQPTNEGTYTVGITNAAGSTNFSFGTFLLALPGMVEAWGSDGSGECNRPATLTNVTGIAAGEYQSIVATDSGTVVQWGQYSDGTNNYSVTDTNHATLPPTSGVVAVAAGLGQALALLANGSITAWGLTNAYGTVFPTNLTGVKAIACGWQFDVALLTNGTVTAWSSNNPGLTPAITNVPSSLTNVTAIAAGPMHTLALSNNGTVAAWGYATNEETNVPAGLTNIVAIAAGRFHSLALSNNGTVVAWGAGKSNNPSDGYDFGQCMVPAGLSNVMAIAAGDFHSVALLNDGVTLVEWGDNSSGQTNVPGELPTAILGTKGTPPIPVTFTYPPIVVKLIAAGGDHTMAAIFSTLVQYPVDVSKDLLLIYNTNSLDSSNVCQYYLTHRPMVSAANVFGINCTTNDIILPTDLTNDFLGQMQLWLTNNPTKRPLYLILFQDIPAEVSYDTVEQNDSGYASVQYYLNTWTATGWQPFVTSINMNGLGEPGYSTNLNSSDGTNDCIAYINKLVSMASNNPPGALFISGSAAGYGNTNWYFDDSDYGFTNASPQTGALGYTAAQGVYSADPSASVFYSYNTIITNGTNVAGYYSLGIHNGVFTGGYPTNGQIVFSGASGWYLIETSESFNGQRATVQGNFLEWFSTNAFQGTNAVGSTNYSNTPIGAVTQVQEPGSAVNNSYIFFGLWASGKTFASCAWNSFYGYGYPVPQMIGDPFTKQ